MNEPAQSVQAEPGEGGIPSWALSAAAVAVIGGALWWGTREPERVPTVPSEATVQSQDAPTGQAGAAKLAEAIELERAGDRDRALVLAREASKAGAGEAAYLLEAKILILQGRHEEARAPLQTILATNPNNADAHYNLGLTWQQGKEPNYNNSRNAYLATLKAEPRYAAARYNLVILCLAHGIVDEGKHHAQAFWRDYPQDPRGATLRERIGQVEAAAQAAAASGQAASGAATPPAAGQK